MRATIDDLALLQTREGGKPLSDSRGGVEAGIAALEQSAELGPLHRGRARQGSWGAADSMIRVSRGVAVLCLPWNDPVAIACAQIAANLAVGNTVICKPSEKTPLATAQVIRMLNEDLPAGVLQLAVGDGALGAGLAGHAGVDVVVHVGSVSTGRSVAAACAARGANGAPGPAAAPHGASGDGLGYGPELLDELTRVRVIHVEPPPLQHAADLRRP